MSCRARQLGGATASEIHGHGQCGDIADLVEFTLLVVVEVVDHDTGQRQPE
jgi:hypothetical protein